MELSNDFSGTMLVIEDSMLSFKFIESSFEPLGFSLFHAKSGEIGLEMLEDIRPDLILMDMVMDGMDGLETCRLIKNNDLHKDIPVIFLTSSEGHDLIQQAFELGAVDYVVKKFNPTEMVARVKTQMQLLRATTEMKEERDRAQRLSEEKSEFLSVAAHDLKNPLAGIVGFAEILKAEYESSKGNGDFDPIELLSYIESSADHMLSILNELLVSQTLENSLTQIDRQIADLCEIARRVVEINQVQAKKKDIRLHFDGTDDTCALVDVLRMREIMDNLVNNAVKYTPLGKQVFVVVGPSPDDPDRVRFLVKDEGAGLTDSDKERLFGRFQKLSAQPTGDETSTGLGLSIVKAYVEMHEGLVWAESVHGEGASFIFEMPRAKPD